MSGIELDNINSEWIGASARCPCMHLVCMYMYAEFLLHAHTVLCRCLFHGSTHLYIPTRAHLHFCILACLYADTSVCVCAFADPGIKGVTHDLDFQEAGR